MSSVLHAAVSAPRCMRIYEELNQDKSIDGASQAFLKWREQKFFEKAEQAYKLALEQAHREGIEHRAYPRRGLRPGYLEYATTGTHQFNLLAAELYKKRVRLIYDSDHSQEAYFWSAEHKLEATWSLSHFSVARSRLGFVEAHEAVHFAFDRALADGHLVPGLGLRTFERLGGDKDAEFSWFSLEEFAAHWEGFVFAARRYVDSGSINDALSLQRSMEPFVQKQTNFLLAAREVFDDLRLLRYAEEGLRLRSEHGVAESGPELFVALDADGLLASEELNARLSFESDGLALDLQLIVDRSPKATEIVSYHFPLGVWDSPMISKAHIEAAAERLRTERLHWQLYERRIENLREFYLHHALGLFYFPRSEMGRMIEPDRELKSQSLEALRELR